jgi:hypothetical protein
MQTFRIVTNTQGVDLYGLTYEHHCTHDGALQKTARFLESRFGINATSDDPFLPNVAILRPAEAVDAIANAARSGASAETATESAGLILCSVVQLGGVLYSLVIVLIAVILLAFLPCVNFVFQLCFDTTVALSKKPRTRPAAGKPPGTKTINATSVTRTTTPAPQRRAARGTRAVIGDGSSIENAQFLSAQQLRALRRTRPSTGALQGLQNRMAELASHALRFGVPKDTARHNRLVAEVSDED